HASCVVAGGEIVALLGPNGAGKTTASRIIAGILAPTEGDAMVDGISVRDDPDRVRGRIGLVTDSPSLYERMTLRAYLVYFARLYDVRSPASRVAELVEAQRISDRVVIVDRGRIVREAPTVELRSGGRPSFRAELVADEASVRGALASVGVTVDGLIAQDGRLEVRWTADDPAETNTRVLRGLLDAGARVISVTAETRSLEDAYLAIIKESRQ